MRVCVRCVIGKAGKARRDLEPDGGNQGTICRKATLLLRYVGRCAVWVPDSNLYLSLTPPLTHPTHTIATRPQLSSLDLQMTPGLTLHADWDLSLALSFSLSRIFFHASSPADGGTGSGESPRPPWPPSPCSSPLGTTTQTRRPSREASRRRTRRRSPAPAPNLYISPSAQISLSRECRDVSRLDALLPFGHIARVSERGKRCAPLSPPVALPGPVLGT